MKDFDKTLSIDLSGKQDNDPVLFSVKPGDGQVNYSVFTDFQGNYVYGDVQNKVLGTVKEIKGKSLLVVTLVTDTNPNTNRTSVRFVFNDIKTGSQITDANADNGTVSYNITFDFK